MPDDWQWGPDILEGYESRFVNLGEAFDGPARCTIIRLRPAHTTKKGFLYIHGFNDYFFQADWGRQFVDSGYAFYAVDLRRYGRSRLPWQYPFNVRDQREYFADIDSAINQMRRDGITDITLGGHSTGGLTVAYYAATRGRRIPVQRVVTDSPFLEWNYNAFMRGFAAPLIGRLGHLFPEAEIRQGHCDGYAYSLLKDHDGEWTYNTNWKMTYSPPVKWGWIGAIDAAHSGTVRNREHIAVPLLVMTSSRKISGCDFTPEFPLRQHHNLRNRLRHTRPHTLPSPGTPFGPRLYIQFHTQPLNLLYNLRLLFCRFRLVAQSNMFIFSFTPHRNRLKNSPTYCIN